MMKCLLAGEDGEAGGRILFKKPKKTTTESKTELEASSQPKSIEKDNSSDKKKSNRKALKNTNLLSFTEDEEECD